MAADETPAAETGGDVSTTAQPLHPVTHWEQLNEQEEAENNDDADSVISNPAESTASMTSSILSYRTIQGRTFHSERGNAQYWAANDEQQNESMDVVHHFLSRLLDDKLFLSPLKDNIQSALDNGTGTEHVLMLKPGSDFADQFPSAKVVGTDISPIQPSWVPPNLEFHIDDCTQPWTFAPDSIDFVHMRYLFGSIKDWFFIEGGKKMGQPCTIIEDDLQQKCMREAGFEDIHIADYKIAIGGWPKDKKMREIGQYVLAALEQDFEGYVLYMASQLLGWSMQEVKVYCAQLRRELRSTANHPFFRYRAVYGRKPQAS
ncbi:methyltransferase [Fusarium mexicanum]|uniref:Methyltransferase n=1 Tax=Fusarium mexicanum TaxID=751941 RepID=A0A8H5MRL6_9HYPO|nr:methyltransferase [Fusarium mexicanum]